MKKLRLLIRTLALAIAVIPLVQAAVTCGLEPLKPLTPLGCEDLELQCLCDNTGQNCSWKWICAKGARVRTNAPIPMGIVPPVFEDPAKAAIRVQELRRLRLENQKLEQEIRARDAVAPAPPPPVVPSTVEAQPLSGTDWNTQGFMNGRFWKASSVIAKATYLMGFCDGLQSEASASYRRYATGKSTYGELSDLVDQFYSDPANALISVPAALLLVNLKVTGAEQSTLDIAVADARRSALAPAH
jgi:hypothetical protein